MLWTAANINQRGCVNKCAQEIAGSRHAGTRSSLSFALGTALQGDGHQLLRTQHQLPRPDTRTQLRLHALEMLSVLPGWPWRRARPPPQLPGGAGRGCSPAKQPSKPPGGDPTHSSGLCHGARSSSWHPRGRIRARALPGPEEPAGIAPCSAEPAARRGARRAASLPARRQPPPAPVRRSQCGPSCQGRAGLSWSGGRWAMVQEGWG